MGVQPGAFYQHTSSSPHSPPPARYWDKPPARLYLVFSSPFSTAAPSSLPPLPSGSLEILAVPSSSSCTWGLSCFFPTRPVVFPPSLTFSFLTGSVNSKLQQRLLALKNKGKESSFGWFSTPNQTSSVWWWGKHEGGSVARKLSCSLPHVPAAAQNDPTV